MSALDKLKAYKAQVEQKTAEAKNRINQFFMQDGDEMTLRIVVDELKEEHLLFVNQEYDEFTNTYKPAKYFKDVESAQKAGVRVTPIWYLPTIIEEVNYAPGTIAKLTKKNKKPDEVATKLKDGNVRFFAVKGDAIDALVKKFGRKKPTQFKWVLTRVGSGTPTKYEFDDVEKTPMTPEQQAAEVQNLLATVTMYSPTDELDNAAKEKDVPMNAERTLDFA